MRQTVTFVGGPAHGETREIPDAHYDVVWPTIARKNYYEPYRADCGGRLIPESFDRVRYRIAPVPFGNQVIRIAYPEWMTKATAIAVATEAIVSSDWGDKL